MILRLQGINKSQNYTIFEASKINFARCQEYEQVAKPSFKIENYKGRFTVCFWSRSLYRFSLNQSRSKRSITEGNVQIVVSMIVDLTPLMVASRTVSGVRRSTCSFNAATARNPSNWTASRTIWKRGKTSI